MPHKFKIRATKDTATVYVYEEIGSWGVSGKDFADQMQGLDVDYINVRINSPGGDVFEGLAMYNLLRDNRAEVTVDIDGWAASAASVVAMAGDHINMAANAFMLVHAPWTIHGGNAKDFRQMADQLEAIEGSLVDTYASRRSLDRQTVAEWVSAETLFSASEAVDVGMADTITAESAIAASADFSTCRWLPRAMRERVGPIGKREAEERQQYAAESQLEAAGNSRRRQTQLRVYR